METKPQKSRTTLPDTLLYPPLPKEEGLKSCGGIHEKIAVVDDHHPSLVKNSKIGLLKPTLKIDRKLVKSKPVISSTDTVPTKREATPVVSVSNDLNSLKLSSTDFKTTDNAQLRRPVKLAPLELPAEVKEAQMRKITTMANCVYLNGQKTSHRNVPYQCPTKSDPPKKIGTRENKLPRLPEDVTWTKGNVSVKDVSSGTNSFPRDLRFGDSSLFQIKSDSRDVINSIPKTTSPQDNESGNVFAEGKFRSSRCQNINQGSHHGTKINGPAGEDYVEMRTIGKLGC